VVWIADELAATTMTERVTRESFRTVAGPTYGTVYRGVAMVPEACEDCQRGHDADGDVK
jgi:hypothetical protein